MIIRNLDRSWIFPKSDLRIKIIPINKSEWEICVRLKGAVIFIGWIYWEIILMTTRIYLISNCYVNLAITHNWLVSLRDFFDWWLLCEVTVEEVIVYCWQWQYLVYGKDYWTFVDTVEEKVHSHIAYLFIMFCPKIIGRCPQGKGISVLKKEIWSALCYL